MKALVILNNYKKFDGFIRDIVSDSFLNQAIKDIEAITTTQQPKTVTSTHTNLIYCPIKNSSCILTECAAYTTNKEPDIMKCDSCGDTFRRGERCKNYIKGKPEHIKMSLYKNMAYCKHFKRHVFI